MPDDRATRAERYHRLIAVYKIDPESQIPDADLDPLCLLQHQATTDAYWTATFDTLEEASAYQDADDGGWAAVLLADLRTGALFFPRTTFDAAEGGSTLDDVL